MLNRLVCLSLVLSLAAMESPSAFAGPITAMTIDDVFLQIDGSSRVDSLRVTQLNGSLVLTAEVGSTINGVREMKIPTAGIQFVQIEMNAGSDSVMLKQIEGDFEISVLMGAGHDSLILSDVVVTGLYLDVGAGNDSTKLNGVWSSDLEFGYVVHDGGPGNDRLIFQSGEAPSVRLFGGDGSDSFHLVDVTTTTAPRSDGSFDGWFTFIGDESEDISKHGADTLSVRDCTLRSSVFSTEGGNDVVSLLDSTLEDEWLVDLGTGNDHWFSAWCTFTRIPDSMNGYTGLDRFTSRQDLFEAGPTTPEQFEFVSIR